MRVHRLIEGMLPTMVETGCLFRRLVAVALAHCRGRRVWKDRRVCRRVIRRGTGGIRQIHSSESQRRFAVFLKGHPAEDLHHPDGRHPSRVRSRVQQERLQEEGHPESEEVAGEYDQGVQMAGTVEEEMGVRRWAGGVG